jgi:TatD DNase family protein
LEVYDMHCHCSELPRGELEAVLESHPGLTIVAVSEEPESLVETVELAQSFPGRLVPCAGFHPWVIGEASLAGLEEVLRWAYRLGLGCLGEVGLDRRFVPQTWRVQVSVFSRVLEAARELDAMVNIHAPDAWADALSMLIDHGVERAMFHWYTGPQTLIHAIGEAGYKISINPALRIQRKHREIARLTPLDYMVTESDGPYNYKGLRLSPAMIPETINTIASLHNTTPQQAAEKLAENARKLLRRAHPQP